MNRLKEIKDEAGVIAASYIYDENGLVIASTDASGYSTEYTYDIGGRLLTAATPEAVQKGRASVSYTYDAMDNIVAVTDGEGNTTRYDRDMWGRAVRITKADGSQELYAYDYAGNTVSSTDGNGNTTYYSYNSLNKLSAVTDPDGLTITYKYDREGRMVYEKDRNGETINYVYNSDNNLTYKGIEGTDDYIKYLYDENGNLVAAVNKNAVETYEYNANGWLVNKLTNGRIPVSYQYNKNGQIVNVSGLNGETGYGYDSTGKLVSVGNGQNIIAEYTYNPNSTISKVTYNSGIMVNYEYDRDNNITRISGFSPLGDLMEDFRYVYDNNGNIVSQTVNGQETVYAYDALNRLVSENNIAYSYDNAGNRTRKAEGTDITVYAYDSRNRLIHSESGGIITTYNYDNNGNLLASSDGKVYNYDRFNRLVEAMNPDGTWQANIYGPDGLRMGVLENGLFTGFVYNHGQVIEEYDASGSVTASYVRGIGLIAMKDAHGLSYYLNNVHGDITAIAEANGNILNSYRYDAFGNATYMDETIANRFMYTGEQYDRITGTYYLRARYYDPTIGRFIQEDTYRGDGLNLYAYVANNPLKYIDPNGHDKQKIRESDTLPVGTPVEAINYATSSNLSTIDLLARTLYVESIEDENAMLAVAWTIMNRVSLEMAGKGDWTYDIVIDYEARKVVPGTKVDMEATLRNVVLTPMQYTGLTGGWEHKGMGHPNALSPKTDSSKWKLAVEIATIMVNDPDSLELLKGLEGVTSFRAIYRFSDIDENNRTAVLDGEIVYNIYIYGDNLFFK